MKPTRNLSISALTLLLILNVAGSTHCAANEAPAAEHSTESPFTREEVDHRFGTQPGTQFTPLTAIDTNEVPNIAFSADTADDDPLKYYQIAPDTYFFYANIAEVDENNRGFNGNAGFVITDDSVVLIDSLGSPRLGKRIVNTVRSLTDKPIKYLIITHNHPDHAYGASAIKAITNARVIGHEGTLKYIQSDRIEHSVNYRKTFIAEDMAGFTAVPPDIMISGELYQPQTLTSGGKTFDIYNTGSHHSYGDLVIHQREDNIVWISDLAFNNRVTFMADGHSELAVDAQQWLLETFADAKLMVPGHGSVQTPPFAMVRATRDYINQLRKDVTSAIQADKGLQETVDSLEYPQWQSMNLYELNHKKNVDFVYRELEAELF